MSGAFFMPILGRQSVVKIIKKINTSAAIALDSKGREIVVIGKGIGFPKVPYELEDMSVIERTFYDMDPKYIAMISEIPQSIILSSAEISEEAEIELNCRLNPNLPFTLADHLHFAIERLKNGIDMMTPIAYDVQHLYPKESQIGVRALQILKENANVILPDTEAVNIALHLINAEAELGDVRSAMQMMKILTEVEKIVEKHLEFKLDRESYHYSRFTMHLRYLIQRLSSSNQVVERGASMLRTLAKEYPDIYNCALQIAGYFEGTWGWKCNEEETLYLMLHIHRVQQKNH